jgi:hypothetical protein
MCVYAHAHEYVCGCVIILLSAYVFTHSQVSAFEEVSIELLRRFFSAGNEKAPPEKRARPLGGKPQPTSSSSSSFSSSSSGDVDSKSAHKRQKVESHK